MPVLTPGPTMSGFFPKNRLHICSSGNCIGGTTLETITSCTCSSFTPAKSNKERSCRPYSSPVRSFSVWHRKDSRKVGFGARSNSPSTVLVLPTSIARSMPASIGSARVAVNKGPWVQTLQDPARGDVARHDPSQCLILRADEQRPVLRQVDRVAFQDARRKLHPDAPTQGRGELAPAIPHGGESLHLVQRQPLVERLEKARAGERPGDLLALLDPQAGGLVDQLVREVLRLQPAVEPDPQHHVPGALPVGAKLAEEPGQLAAV